MTIKQLGGVFGRNPTFNDVTIEGTLSTGKIAATVSGDETAIFNRTTSDGDIVEFRKDDAPVGSIGSRAGSVIYITSQGTGKTGLDFGGTSINPMLSESLSNGTTDLGNAGNRFRDLYLSGKAQADTYQFTQNSAATGATEAIYRPTTGQMAFKTNSSEAMRIDSSGNVLVGKTATNIASDGVQLFNDGFVHMTADISSGSQVLTVNRKTSDGDLAVFRKDGTAVGSVGTIAGDLTIGDDDIGIRFDTGTGLVPWDLGANATGGLARDAAIDIGASSARFKDLYRSGSTISTSDRNMKQDERDLTEAETRVAQACKGLLKAFRFIDAVEVDGDDARIHFGIIAQDLQAAFEAEGLDATKYAMFRPSTFTDDEGNEQVRLGVCYENLLAFIIAAI